MTAFKTGVIATLAAGSLMAASMAAQADENVMIVFDGSNSMWGQIDGVAKIEIARGVMENLLGDWSDTRRVGLMAYGHRARGDCTDIETLIAPAPGTRADILARINAITPTGKTPLTDAVEQAARALSYEDSPATVILISDGLESCERDPCALADALEKGGVGFTAHVVGFGLGGDADTASLACIAERTGGQYLSAQNADELGRALSAVATAVASTPEPEPAPEPEPQPDLPQVTLTGPESAVIGSTFTVTWDPALDPQDYVTIVPAGTKEGTYGNYVTVQDKTQGELRAPAETGLYELRYIARRDSSTLGRAPIEIVDAEVTVSGPDRVLTGAQFDVAWTGTVSAQDYVTIVPMGAEEGTYGSYKQVRDQSEETLTAAAEPGLYEIRYVLREGGKTLATQPVEIAAPEVTVSGPDRVLTGAQFDVAWTGAVSAQDYVTIVPMGAEEGTYGSYKQVRDQSEETLTAAAEPGLYEIRYVLREGGKTLATQPVEIAAPEVTVSGPQSALAGATATVTWTGAVSSNDYITIVPVGAEEGTYGNYKQVRDADRADLVLPGTPGLYEIRYILREGERTLAAQPIEAIAATITLTAPDQIRLGDDLPVEWSQQINTQDYINLVPMGAAPDAFGRYTQVRDARKETLRSPDTEGLYELRYILRENGAVLARLPVEVLAADAALDAGASLSAPESGPAGSTVEVGFDVETPGADHRVTLARPDQALFTWVTAIKIDGTAPVLVPLPAEPGIYELRYLDIGNQAVLARKIITVE